MAEVMEFAAGGAWQEVPMSGRSLKVTVLLLSTALPASALGDSTFTLAAYRAATATTASPGERLMAVYMASPQRAAMLERLRGIYPALLR
jgi:hypothetical protein